MWAEPEMGKVRQETQFWEAKFGQSVRSVTEACKKEEMQLSGRKIVIVNTPGFFHTHCSNTDIAAEVRKCVKLCSSGPHVILQVMHAEHFSQEKDVAQFIKEIFGLKARNYMTLLFTHKVGLEDESLENIIPVIGKNLKEYIAECGN